MVMLSYCDTGPNGGKR